MSALIITLLVIYLSGVAIYIVPIGINVQDFKESFTAHMKLSKGDAAAHSIESLPMRPFIITIIIAALRWPMTAVRMIVRKWKESNKEAKNYDKD